MKILVIGGGSIGRRHLTNFSTLPDVEMMACELNPDRIKQIQTQLPHVKTFTDLDTALAQKPDAALICTPPHLHVAIGRKAAEAGAHLMIEKPIAHNLDGLADLLSFCEQKKLVVMTAYMFRFSPAMQKMAEIVASGKLGKPLSVRTEYASYLPEWHPWEDYRHFYMAKKAQGGGAILDESHAIDFTRWIVGEVESVFAFNGNISPLEIDSDDVAEIVLRFKNGAVGSVHLDLYSRSPRGRMEVRMEKGEVVWDRFRNDVTVFDVERNVWETYPSNFPYADLYISEAKEFLRCIKTGARPVCDGWNGLQTLQVVMAAIQSSQEGKRITLKLAQPKEMASIS